MDLISRVGLLVVVLIAVFGIILALQHTASAGPLTEQQAEQLVVTDLQKSYQGATVSVINVTRSPVQSGAWRITVLLVLDPTSPCPSVSIEGFDYPATRLVPSSYNNYTASAHGCTVYSGGGAVGSSEMSAEIAIAMSYHDYFPTIMSYVDDYGYGNMHVHATLCSNPSDVWLVNYSAQAANKPLYVLMHQNGTIIGTSSIPQC